MKKSHATKRMDGHIKALRFIGFLLIATILLTAPAAASTGAPNYAQNAGQWVLDQIFWVALIASVVVLVKLIIARNFMAMIITGAGCAVALVIIDDPNKLKAVGDAIWSVVSSAS